MTTSAVDDAIEREVFIEAAIDHVWSLVSRTGFWVGELLHFDGDAAEGDAAEGETAVIDAGRHGSFPVRVERLDPPQYAAYRWASGFPGAQPSETNSTLVEITLLELRGGVLLRLRESGFATLDGGHDFRAARLADNSEGWTGQLEKLTRVAERDAA